MDILLLFLMLVLIALASIMLLKTKSRPGGKEVDLLIKNTLLEFQSQIQDSVNGTRKEMTDAREDINQRTRETLRLMSEMRSTVEKIIIQQEETARLGRSLKDILQAPKIRGNYGEVILEEMLEKVLPKGMWTRQHKLGDGAVVDVAVHYRDILIPIDAKFPRDNYLKYLNCDDERDKELHWKMFERDVIMKIREIAKYVAPDCGTADFALMFIPSESVYYETVTDKNYLGHSSRILEEAEKHKVMPVSPNTFYVFLQVILSGIRNLEVLHQARSIQEKLSFLQTKFDLFYKQYETVGKELEKAADAYRKGDRHINSFKKELDNTVTVEIDEDSQFLA